MGETNPAATQSDVQPIDLQATRDSWHEEKEPAPTNEQIEHMLSQFDDAEIRDCLRSLAQAVALSWDVIEDTAAWHALRNWLATAELYSDPDSLRDLVAARKSAEAGNVTAWEDVKQELAFTTQVPAN